MSNLSPGTHSFTLDGTRQVYHVAGRGPVLIAHSGGPGVDYSYLRSDRLEEHFTVVYLEPVGTGGSRPLPPGATYVDTYVDFLYAVVEHLDVPKVHVLGHSHGGVVAQRFALRYPERVAGLALYSSTPVTDPEFWAAGRAEAVAYPERLPDVPEAAAVTAAFTSSEPERDDEEKTATMRAVLPIYFADFWGRRAEFEPLQKGIRTWLVQFESNVVDYRVDLPKITARTVVLTGRHDFICGPRWAGMLSEGIAGSRLVILENSGHFGQIEEPEAFLEAVTWLLAGSFSDEVRATFRRGDNDAVLRLAGAEIERARAAGEPAGEVEGLYATARVALREGDLARAEELAQEALDVAVRSGDRRLEERPRHVLAAVARMSGDYAEARSRYLAGIALNEALGQPEMVNSEYHNLAFTELKLGHLDRARELFAQGRERVFREGYLSFVPYLGVAAAAMASADGDHASAARMIGFTDRAYAVVAQVPDPDDAQELLLARTLAVAALDEDRFAAEYATGSAMSADEAFRPAGA
ncbi:alpha/beta fold hydrolase [Actinoplanes sp. ATCC 53533]|uniref:alpha/beta fold hydrolase n=1 Tax=Actinoplanes sp. ATCC 53533 TaxID=1288362 RepID=UPI001F3A1D7E|nr:alpha/beta fold hydrolase [Actinoplanes sp. ATCC 53533]